VSESWRMSAEDAEEYTRALGQVMSGGWRQIALAQRLGVPEAIGMTTEDWVRDRIGGYVRLGIEERREAVRELTDKTGEFGLSQRQAAEVLGIGKDTVRRDLLDGADAPVDAESLGSDIDDGGADAPAGACTEPEPQPEPERETDDEIVAELLESIPDPDVASAAMAEAAALLDEPEEERAFYMVGRQRFWMRLPPERVADASTSPDQDAPEWEAFGVWCSRVGESLRARARQRVRLVE
jgi:hypothetical protein